MLRNVVKAILVTMIEVIVYYQLQVKLMQFHLCETKLHQEMRLMQFQLCERKLHQVIAQSAARPLSFARVHV